MRFVFDSQLYPESLLSAFISDSKGGLDFAAHNLCKAFYLGLIQNNQDVELVNAPNIGSFPFLYRRPKIKGVSIENGVSLPFWNLTYLKRYDLRRRLHKQIDSSLEQHKDEKTILLLYNYRCLPFLPKLKRRYPSLMIGMIITDLPEFMMPPSSKLLSAANRIFSVPLINRDSSGFEAVDFFILLSEYMKERLPISEKPWIRIEGIYNDDTKVAPVEKEPYKTVLYTGDLGRRYGVVNLVQAFHEITDDNFRLWLCGDGDGKEDILEYAKKDNRIIYKGMLPRREVLTLQSKATVLLNPRNSKDDYTKYSFPSKTMEYLASGTPVIMSHLASIPEEYNDHIFYLKDETIEGIRNRIVEICNKPSEELKEFGDNASEFIFKLKTPAPQVKRMVDFIKQL